MSEGSSSGNVLWDEADEGPEFDAVDPGMFDLGFRVDGCFTSTAFIFATSAVVFATLGWAIRWIKRGI